MYTFDTMGMKYFRIFNIMFLSLAAIACLVPFIHLIALSFSEDSAVRGGMVYLLPVRFTWEPYLYILEREALWRAFWVSIQRVIIGGGLNIFLLVLIAYPLSKSSEKFTWRTAYVWIFFFTMLFNGGLIPMFILVNTLQIRDTIWALALPNAINVFHIILMLNFFRQIPVELEEAAYIDGASHWRTLWQIYIPVSLPAIATITLFTIVFHWNAWFDGLIFMRVRNYPLASYLQTIVIQLNFVTMSATEMERLAKLNDRSLRAAQMAVAAIPILMAYPFLQRYFISGIVLGSVKG